VKAARERDKRWKYHEISATAVETKRKRLDSEKLSDEEVLKAYKEQQHAEIRFLKDPMFFAPTMG